MKKLFSYNTLILFVSSLLLSLSPYKAFALFEDADARRDAMRKMTWFALMGMLVYPIGIVIADLIGYETTGQLLADIAPTYFVAISALVAAFFGANAYVEKKKK